MRLQKAPSGLLGAFDLKVEGRNPDEFSDTVVPVVDVYDQYLALNSEVVPGSVLITNPATSNTVTHTVPQGQQWRLLAWGGDGVLAVADAALVIAWNTAVYGPGGIDTVMVQPHGNMTRGGDTNRAAAIGFVSPRPLLLPSGWAIAASVQLSAAPAVSFQFSFDLMIQRILE
jgi:hypothetical protein